MAPASAVAKPDGDDVMIVDKLPAKPDDDDDAMPVDKLPEEINEMKIKGERVEKVFYGPFSSATSFFLFSFFSASSIYTDFLLVGNGSDRG